MNIIFFGSSKFGYPALKGLIEGCYKIPLVVTQPDKKQGRGLKFGATQIKELAEQARLKIFQPEDVNSPESAGILKKHNPDLFVIIAYGQKFSKDILGIPRIMAINVHASALPKYRGAAPINWAVINADRNTGNTVMKVVPRMDAGPIIIQSQIGIDDSDDSVTLEEKLSEDCGSLLLKAIRLIESNNFRLLPQDEALASVAPKLSKEIAQINWSEPAIKIYNLVRGCLSWSAAFTKYKERSLKIFKTQVEDVYPQATGEAVPGQIMSVSENGIVVATGKGCLRLLELQLEGKRRLGAREFLSGNKLSTGEKLG
jgi:methionyl-tRNA formyltransferase